MKRILIIDNYDSFTYNLYQYAGEMYRGVYVLRNDAFRVDDIDIEQTAGIIISPGPGYPKDAGLSVDVIKRFSGVIPILGVCLGFQSIVEAEGGDIIHARELMHGKVSDVQLDMACPLFRDMPEKITAARYHSLAASPDTLPKTLTVTSKANDGEIMAVADAGRNLYGVQFHPESVMTEYGKTIIRNFLKITGVAMHADTSAKYTRPPNPDVLKPYIQKAIASENLSTDEAKAAMDAIMAGDATNAQIGSFLTAMRMKGETVDEITGFAVSMRQMAAKLPVSGDTIDIVGTGGDLAKTFNISTTTAFVVAAAGGIVTKHGNRSVSSLCGSADVLEALGANINLSSAQAAECLEKTGLCFMFAPMFHQSMRFAASPRREIGVRSVFNILGPLANPAKAQYMLLGVYDCALLETMGVVLQNLGVKKALVVRGADGLDEVTLTDRTEICEVEPNKITKYSIHPSDFGLTPCAPGELTGATAKENAVILEDILKGGQGPKRDIVLMNAGASLYALGKCFNIGHGIKIAAAAIDEGKAYEKLKQFIEVTREGVK